MVFNSLEFVAFFVVVYALYRAAAAPRRRTGCCSSRSYYFYAAWDWRFLGSARRLDASSTTPSARYLDALERRRADAGGCCGRASRSTSACSASSSTTTSSRQACRSLLSLARLGVSLPTLHVILPIGISFYTFMTMSYVIDVYRREIEPTRRPAGLRRVRRLSSRTSWPARFCARPRCCRRSRGRARPTSRRCTDGAWLIGWGLFKKVFVADNLATRRRRGVRQPRRRPASRSWSASTRSPSRSTATSRATPTSRAACRSGWASS